jgi:hypothetical protein
LLDVLQALGFLLAGCPAVRGVVFNVGMALDVTQRDWLLTLLKAQVAGLRWIR